MFRPTSSGLAISLLVGCLLAACGASAQGAPPEPAAAAATATTTSAAPTPAEVATTEAEGESTEEPAVTTADPAPAPAPSVNLASVPLAERSSVRLINLLEDQPAVQLCVDGAAVSDAVGYGEHTAHHPAPTQGQLGIATDADCTQPSVVIDLDAAPGTQWAAVAAGAVGDDTAQLFLAQDDFSAPPAGFVRTRGLHADPEAGAIDVGLFRADGSMIRLFAGLTFGNTAASSQGLNFDADTGYGQVIPVAAADSDLGAVRAGTDHRIVQVQGPAFEADHVYSVYPAGSVVSNDPPATLFICDDTDAGETSAAVCNMYDATVVGDPLYAENGDGEAAAPAATAATADDQLEFTMASGETRSVARVPNGPVPALPEGATAQFVPFEGQEIHVVEVAGEGPPIVLMHGFPDNIYLYNRLFPELEGRHVVAFDFVGWGQSSKPMPSEYDYSSPQMQKELAAVVDALGLSDITLVVHDASGPPGVDYVLEGRGTVGRIVLLNTYYGLMDGLVRPKAIEIHSTPGLEAVEVAINADAAAMEALYRFQMSEFILTAPGERELIDGLWSQFPEAVPAFTALNDVLVPEVFGRGGGQALADLDVPVDIVFGASDPYLSAGLAQSFDDLLGDSTLTLVDGAGHFVQLDAPVDVAAVILAERR